jgi:hypothetical protein
VRPFSQYAAIHHGLTAEQHAGIAYYFEFDYADGRDPITYAQSLIEQLQLWLDAARRSYLFCDVVDETMYLFSFRPGFSRELIALAGLDRRIYELLDRPRAFRALEELLVKDGLDVGSDALRARLHGFEARGLVMRDADNYLSLAIPLGEYQPPKPVLDAFQAGIERVRGKAVALVT